MLAIWLLGFAATAQAQHAGDILIGQTTAMRLGAANLPTRTLYLPPVSSGAFQGWSSTVLGFDGIVLTNVAEALQPLNAGANVFLEVVTSATMGWFSGPTGTPTMSPKRG
ncbi:MAG: hypothetical protein AB7O66_08805 [Limisphaerales bacterium]